MNAIQCFRPLAVYMISIATLGALADSANAQTLLLDFGNDNSFRGLSVNNPDSNGNYWNSLQTGVFYSNLKDLDDASTTIDFGFSTPVGTDSYNGPAGPTDASSLETDVLFTDIDEEALGNLGGALEAAFDYVASPFPPAPVTGRKVRFEIQGLDPARTYDLTFFASHQHEGDATTVFTVYTDNTYTTPVATTSLQVHDPVMLHLHNKDTVATISDLSPQTDDIFYVEFIGANGGNGYLNDMQIVASAAPTLFGDYNNDGIVDAADYVAWRKLDGTSTPLLNDPNGLPIDEDQYFTWRANFAEGGGGGGSGAVPEPTTLLLTVVAAIGLFSVGRRR